ncbi:hypothetical protein HDU81_010733 [Chytriomyces hyalinus]|nr:hypothetical protein HDU81_010733 [Chytriomyces hyalinus]
MSKYGSAARLAGNAYSRNCLDNESVPVFESWKDEVCKVMTPSDFVTDCNVLAWHFRFVTSAKMAGFQDVASGEMPGGNAIQLEKLVDEVTQKSAKRERMSRFRSGQDEECVKHSRLEQEVELNSNPDSDDTFDYNDKDVVEVTSCSKVGMISLSFYKEYSAAAKKLAKSSSSLSLSQLGRHLKQKSAWFCFADKPLSAIGVSSTVDPQALNLTDGKYGINVAMLEALWKEDVVYRKDGRQFSN